ncbi:MAG: hypothetical protein ACYDEN_13435 [Acidimicrobiales bacterium]
MGTDGFGSMRHLAGRFLGALSPAGPPAAAEAWARSHLLPGEVRLWERMSGPDRRHAVGVARDAITRLTTGGTGAPPRPVVAAALLHDVGKVESGFGTFARVAVTAAAMVVGRERLAGEGAAPARLAGARSSRRAATGWRGRAAAYLAHDRIGADLLRVAGADEVTVAWAREHHLPAERWSVERPVAEALKAADGD